MTEEAKSQTRARPEPTVSIIIIFFNAAKFLEDAIESVFTQTLREWELLLVDDGSTDASVAIAFRHVQLHPDRVRYLQHSGHINRGMSASRNLGLTYARGDFVAFLDADDVWLPEKLTEQLRDLEACPEAAMVYGPGQYWYSWTGDPADGARDFIQDLGVQVEGLFQPPSLIPVFLSRSECTPGVCGVLARREKLLEVGAAEESFRGMYEDQALFTKLALHYPVLVSFKVWYKYRQHEGSCCSIAFRSNAHLDARRDFLTWARRYVRKGHSYYPEVVATLDNEWRRHWGWRSRVKRALRRWAPPYLRARYRLAVTKKPEARRSV